MSCRRLSWLLPLLAVSAMAESAEVLVFYPVGNCQTGLLEIQVFRRVGETGAWSAHPEHPLVAADRCYRERAEILLNEIRVRCVDLEGEKRPSEWVSGVSVVEGLPPEVCG